MSLDKPLPRKQYNLYFIYKLIDLLIQLDAQYVKTYLIPFGKHLKYKQLKQPSSDADRWMASDCHTELNDIIATVWEVVLC